MNSKMSQPQCPWPGPVPYSETQASAFRGRQADVRRLVGLIDRQRFNVLIALSGVGKSSLLQAGLVPYLREAREVDSASFGPVLVARDWAGLHRISAAAVLAKGITRGIDDFCAIAAESTTENLRMKLDSEGLARIARPLPPSEAVGKQDLRELSGFAKRLCSEVGEIILIIDQAEEFLGSGLSGPAAREIEQQALEVLKTLYEGEERLKVVLSMREEYLGRISSLSSIVSGLDKRLFRLEPLPEQAVRQILLGVEMLTEGRVVLSEEAAALLLDWLSKVEISGFLSSPGSDLTRPVDLLRLQALLVALFEGAAEESGGTIVISRQSLDKYRKDLQKRLGREVTEGELAKQALEAHIERLLGRAVIAEPAMGPGKALVRRALVRMAPWLSSAGGYKRHLAMDELVYNSIREDLDLLEVDSEPSFVREAIQEYGSRRDFFNVPLGGESSGFLSGVGSIFWSPQQTATMLVEASFTVLGILADKSVLKHSHGTYELIHDGFGPALFNWGEREKSSLADTKASVVSRRGESFRWSEAVEEVLAHVSWLGCSLSGKTFSGTVFDRCKLAGTIFTRCTFDHCRFTDSELQGVVFIDCSLQGVVMEGCRANSMFVKGGSWNEVCWMSSILDNATIEGVDLVGSVEIVDCSVRFAQIGMWEERNTEVGIENREKILPVAIKSSDLQNSLIFSSWFQCEGLCNKDGVLSAVKGRVAPVQGRLGSS